MQTWSSKQQAVMVAAIGLLCLVYFHTRIYNGLAGPFDVEVRDLAAMEDVPAKEYVRVVRDGRPVDYTQLVNAGFYEKEVRDDDDRGRRSADFRYLDERNRHIVVRVTDSSSGQVTGVLTSMKDMPLSTFAPGEVLYVDCENTNYRFVSLIALAAGLLVLGAGLTMLRSAFRRPKS